MIVMTHLDHCYDHLSSFVAKKRRHLLLHICVPHPGQNGLLDLQSSFHSPQQELLDWI